MTNVAIIGAGPAGMSAAIQLKRHSIPFTLFEKKQKESLLANAWKVENFLGTHPTSGLDLLKKFEQHLSLHNITPMQDEVTSLDYQDNTFLINNLYHANKIIVATGTKPLIHPATSTHQQLIGKNISYNFPHHLKRTKNKKIAIIGAGDAAFDYALNLSLKHEVFVFNRSKKIKASPHLQKLVLFNRYVTYKEQHDLQEVIARSDQLELKFNNNTLLTDYLIICIGRTPQKDFFSQEVLANERNLIKNKLLYFIGDAKNDRYRQVSIAVADGIKVGMELPNSIIETTYYQ